MKLNSIVRQVGCAPVKPSAALGLLTLILSLMPAHLRAEAEKNPTATPAKTVSAATTSTPEALPAPPTLDPSFRMHPELAQVCQDQLKRIKGSTKSFDLPKVCSQVRQLSACTSVKGAPIYHLNKQGDVANSKHRRILVFTLVHGDEEESGAVGRAWMSRLLDIETRNSWRVIPLLNPDGWESKTRTNANGVDVNRNFPSRDWNDLAHKYWKSKSGANKRRFPGEGAGSEPETLCAMQHIEDFSPDFIISVHTPLGVLDFDGPKVSFPKFSPLPWVSLGNFPGSLGRYMWLDRNVPVLTVELKADHPTDKLEEFDRLQDITGTVAIQAEQALKSEKKKPAPKAGSKNSAESKNRPSTKQKPDPTSVTDLENDRTGSASQL